MTPQGTPFVASAPSGAVRWSLTAVSGLFYFLAFPPVDRGAFAFVALTPLVLAVRGASRSRAFLLGWVAGTIAGTALVASSIAAAGTHYFSLPPAVAWAFGAFGAQLYGAPYFAVFALLAREIEARRREPAVRALALAAAWVTCELARSRLGDGAPWALLAHSQSRDLRLLQIADLTGAAGPSFLVALVGSALAVALSEIGWSRPASLRGRAPALARLALIAVAPIVAALAYGHASRERWSRPDAPPWRVAIVQGSLPDAWRYSTAHLPEALARMRTLTGEAAASQPRLVVWPENAVSISVEANRAAFAEVARALPATAHLLLGAPRAVASGPGRAELRNSALLLAPDGDVVGISDKQVLMPWAETWAWPISRVSRWLPRSPGDYAPGAASDLLSAGGVALGAPICSEALDAELVRSLVERGAEVLVNPSNDAWFAGRPAVEQHLAAVVLRAVENRRPFVRAATTGISAVIAPTGEIVARAPRDEPAVLVADVIPRRELTPYTRVGDAFGWSCVVALGLCLLLPGGAARGTGRGSRPR